LLELRQLKAAEQAFRELELSYHEALDAEPANPWHWFQAAPLCLQRGDLEGYRRVCREMLARFSDSDDPRIANRTATTCLLVPAAVDDLRPVLRLTERAMTGSGPNSYGRFEQCNSAEIGVYSCWFLLVKGMAHYRTGHYDDAIAQLKQAHSLGRESRYFNSRSLTGTAHAFLAMAHHRLGRPAEARQALDQATELLEQPYSKIGWNWNIDLDWDNWLRFYLVHREAETLVKAKRSP
jgi:tetratricopeptide (TPR) repeat protein